MKIKRIFASVIIISVFLTACGNSSNEKTTDSKSENSEESKIMASESITVEETNTTDVPVTEPETEKTGKVDTDWGWYEMAEGYEQYSFDRGTFIDENGEYVPTAMISCDWDFEQKCFIDNMTGKPIVYCSTIEIQSLDGTFSLEFPGYVNPDLLNDSYNSEYKYMLYPETLQECIEYCVKSYDERPWECMLDMYHDAMMRENDTQLNSEAFGELYSNFNGISDVYKTMMLDMLYENPDAFNVFSENGISYSVFTGDNGMYYLAPDYTMPKDEYQKKLEEFEPAWDEYMQNIRELVEGTSDMATALIVADYICQHCTYDDSLTHRSAYDGLIEGTTVCMGYTQWFNSTMKELGYDVTYVNSYDMNHVWSAVYFEKYNDWFEIDVTWMDGSFYDQNGELNEGTDLKYFGFSSNDYSAFPDHYCNDQESFMIYQKNAPQSNYRTQGYGYSLIGSGWMNESTKSVNYIGNNEFEITGQIGESGTITVE